MNTRSTTILIAVIALVVVAASCGGDEESSSASNSVGSGSPSPGKATFIKQANTACLREREGAFSRIATYRKRHRSKGWPEAVMVKNAIRAAVLSTVEAEIDALRALEAPIGDEDRIDAILAAEQTIANEVWKLKEWSKEVAVYFVDTNKELRAYGLTGCAV